MGRHCSYLMRFFGPTGHCNNRWSALLLCARSSSSFSTSSQSPTAPSKPSKAWERGAKLVKNTDVTNPYLEQVRSEVVDPALQMKTIEDELCGAIGKALGRQGEKVLFAIRDMKEAHSQYLECIQSQAYEEAVQHATRHNDARKRAIKARWELLVHRQAVGFTVDNHSVIHKTFPISEPLPVEMEDIIAIADTNGDTTTPKTDISAEQKTEKKKVWGDQ